LSDCFVEGQILSEEADPTVFFSLATSFVGFEAAVSFLDFYKNYERNITWEEIVNDGKVEKTKDFDINQHCALVEKMDASGIFSEELNDNQLDNLSDYFKLMPSEVAMKLWKSIASASSIDQHDTIKKFHSRVQTALTEMLSE